jgi:hypothetical protein
MALAGGEPAPAAPAAPEAPPAAPKVDKHFSVPVHGDAHQEIQRPPVGCRGQ